MVYGPRVVLCSFSSLLGGIVLLGVALLVACGPGYDGPPVAISTATPSPPPIPTESAFTSTYQAALPVSGTTTTDSPISLPSGAAASGYTGTVTLPAGASIPADTQVTETVTNIAPAGLPALEELRVPLDRQNDGLRSPLSEQTELVIIELGFTKTVTLPTGLAFVIKVPAADILPHVDYYLAFYDPTNPQFGLQLGFAGPATVSGSTLTFASSTSNLTLIGGVTYIFVLYAVSVAVPTPSPVPTFSPTPKPSPTATATAPPASGSISIAIPTPAPVVCTPAPVTVPLGESALLECTAQDYSGPFTLTVANPAIASVQQVNPQTLTFFHVNGLAVGSTTLSLLTLTGGTGSVAITVSP